MMDRKEIEQLVKQANIARIIGDHVALTPKGKNLNGRCPFHKNPDDSSFTVSPEKHFFHCFACGAHGSVIGFLSEHLGMTFQEAVEAVAIMTGVPPLAGTRNEKRDKTDVIHAIYAAANKVFQDELKQSATAIEFLKQRNVTGAVAARYRLGYAPKAWQYLEGKAGIEAYGSTEMLATGLVVQSDNGKLYEAFRHRLTFPLTNVQGRIVGVVGRAVDDADKPAYFFTSKSALIGVEQDFFGLAVAYRAVKQAKEIVVVPGCLATLALHAAGIEHAVGFISKAKFIKPHYLFLQKLAPTVTLCFVESEVGQSEAWRSLQSAAAVMTDKTQLKYAIIPSRHSAIDTYENWDRPVDDLDPVDITLAIQTAKPFSDYLIELLAARADQNTTEGRASSLAALDEIFEGNKKAVRIHEMLRERLTRRWKAAARFLEATEAHDEYLLGVLSSAKKQILIVSPWITKQGITRFDLANAIRAATARGVCVQIVTDIAFNLERRKSYGGDLIQDGSYDTLVRAGSRLDFVKGVHSKVVIVDTDEMCIGSFNWLSAARSGAHRHHEVSVVYRDRDLVIRVKEKLQKSLQLTISPYPSLNTSWAD